MRRSAIVSDDVDAGGESSVQVIDVTGAKGGVGQSNEVVSLAVSLSKTGRRVRILDADVGLCNLDVLLIDTDAEISSDVTCFRSAADQPVAVDRFLPMAIELVGGISCDDEVPMAVMQQKAVADMSSEAPAARAFRRLAQ